MNYTKVWRKIKHPEMRSGEKFRGKLISELDEWDKTDYEYEKKEKIVKRTNRIMWFLTITVIILITYFAFNL